MGANAPTTTKSSGPPPRRPRRRAFASFELIPSSASEDQDARSLVDDLGALVDAGLIDAIADGNGTVRYRAVDNTEIEED